MVNSILKLKVESEEYDAKLKKAAEGIRHLAEVAHKGGGELTGLEKAELDYIKALGDMETKSRTAAGSTRELENAFKELTVIYNNLNDVEKADEGGKALAASLEKLKQRTIDAKSQLDAATKSLQSNESAGQSNSSALEQLASKFTVNIDALKLFNIGLQALDAALGVAKDAFFSSETNVDEWGRTVESAKGIYEGFLQSINTGDISGFLNNINQITAAAREAYNALDELGTRQTILNPERAKLQARSTELKATIRREGADSAAGKAAAAELKALEKPLTEAWKTESKLNRDAFTALVKERLAEGGINLNQKSFNAFMKTFSDDKAFQQLRQNAKGSLTTGTYGNAGITATKITDTRNTEQKLMDLFTDEWRQANSGYLTAAYNAQGSAASTMLGDARYLKGGKGGSGSGNGSPKQEIQFADDSIMAQEKLVQKLTQDWKTASAAVKDDYKKQLDEAQTTLNKMLGKVPEPVVPGSLKAYQEQLKESQSDLQGMREDLLRLKEAGAEPMEIAVKEDEIQDAIDNISTIEKKIDELNGKSANISINIGDEAGSFDIGESMMEKLRDEIAASAENADMSTITEFIKQGIENGVDSADMTYIGQKLIQRMTNGDDIDPSDMEDFLATMKEKLQGIIDEEEWPKIEIAVKTGDLTAIQEFTKRVQVASKTAEDGWKHAASAISTLGSALNQIEDPMAKVVGTIAMAVAQVAEAAGKAINAKDTTSSGWAWIGAAAAITATMVSTIATIHSATKFADGGIVPGSTMSGDQIPALLNAQEVVLNHAQVGNLAAQLEGGSSQGGQPNVRIEGEDLWITLNNYTQRSGYGEIVTSK